MRWWAASAWYRTDKEKVAAGAVSILTGGDKTLTWGAIRAGKRL